jgi:hypothetical protein
MSEEKEPRAFLYIFPNDHILVRNKTKENKEKQKKKGRRR